ncbi:MAG: hypothetical protein LC122_09455 [Chitinophagales bacterium]|nr:hypothetical protein [Chitinophagales bacterium]
MEPDIKVFFKRIIIGAFIVFLWMTINVTVGLKFGYAYWNDKFTLHNFLFYLWLILSAILFFLLIKHLWNKPINKK